MPLAQHHQKHHQNGEDDNGERAFRPDAETEALELELRCRGWGWGWDVCAHVMPAPWLSQNARDWPLRFHMRSVAATIRRWVFD